MADPQSIQESQNLSMFLANHNRITQVGVQTFNYTYSRCRKMSTKDPFIKQSYKYSVCHWNKANFKTNNAPTNAVKVAEWNSYPLFCPKLRLQNVQWIKLFWEGYGRRIKTELS